MLTPHGGEAQPEQNHGQGDPEIGQTVEQPTRHLHAGDHGQNADTREHELSLEEEILVREIAFRRDAAGGEDHDQAESGQKQGAHEQPGVQAASGGLVVDIQPLVHARASTARLKSSPRSP